MARDRVPQTSAVGTDNSQAFRGAIHAGNLATREPFLGLAHARQRPLLRKLQEHGKPDALLVSETIGSTIVWMRGVSPAVSWIFMNIRFGSVAVVVCATMWLFIAVAKATSVVAPAFEEMADKADLVFEGKVIGSRAEWRSVAAGRVIFTLVEFETQEVLKGNAGVSVTLQFLGGTVEGVTLEVADVPRFNPGERVVLFVEGNGVQFCPVVGVFHGKFGLRKDDKNGRDIVLMHDGKPLRDVAEIGAGKGAEFGSKRSNLSIPADREPMSVDDFKKRIRSHLAKTPAHE